MNGMYLFIAISGLVLGSLVAFVYSWFAIDLIVSSKMEPEKERRENTGYGIATLTLAGLQVTGILNIAVSLIWPQSRGGIVEILAWIGLIAVGTATLLCAFMVIVNLKDAIAKGDSAHIAIGALALGSFGLLIAQFARLNQVGPPQFSETVLAWAMAADLLAVAACTATWFIAEWLDYGKQSVEPAGQG
jgi:hypothetical protein